MPSVLSSNEKKTKSEETQKNAFQLPTEILNYECSILYVKKLIVMAISNIAYLRALFPEKIFVERNFEGILIKILKPDSNDFKDSQVLSEWFQGVFDALDRKYLRCLSLSLFENEATPENVLETYDFNILYTDKEAQLALDIKKAKTIEKEARMTATRMIRALLCISNSLNQLPSRLFINMRLFYYDDRTPADYEPKGFKPCEFDNFIYGDGYGVKIDGGKVHTYWHTLKLNVTVAPEMLTEYGNDYNTINDTFDSTTNLDEEISSSQISKKPSSYKYQKKIKHKLADKSYRAEDVNASKLNTEVLVEEKSLNQSTLIEQMKQQCIVAESPIDRDDSNLSSMSSESDAESELSAINTEAQEPAEEKLIIKCGCGVNKKTDLDLLKCENCSNWQHSVCYNLYFKNEVEFESFKLEKKYKHICNECALNSNLAATDPTQLNLNEDGIRELCTWRYLLIWCSFQKKQFTVEDLSGYFEVSKTLALDYLKKLEAEGVVKYISKKGKVFQVMKTKLKATIANQFNNNEKSSQKKNEKINKVEFNLKESDRKLETPLRSPIAKRNLEQSLSVKEDLKINTSKSFSTETEKQRLKKRLKSSITKTRLEQTYEEEEQ